MKEIKIIYEDGDYEYTKVYGSPEDIKKYYIGKWFNVGTVADEMKKCTDVIFL